MTAGYTPAPATVARLEDADWLLSFGTPALEVAERVGLKVASLARMYHRAGRPHPVLDAERDWQRQKTRTTNR